MAPQTAATLERKREESIAKKEAERKQKVEEIKQRKAELKLQREEQSTLKQAKEAREREEEMRRLELAKKREQNIHAREAQRKEKAKTDVAPKSARGQGTKYSKAEILMMKEVFDSYDTDGSGEMTVSELKKSLDKYKEGDRSRNSTMQSAFLICEPLFDGMDTDKDGVVTFSELLRVIYPYATEAEMETFLSWVKEAEPEPEKEPEITPEQEEELRAIFDLYDKDRSESLTMKELQEALKMCGMEPSEIEAIFKANDREGDGIITFEEFKVMMHGTGIF